jgi:hypothetical protein
MRGVTDIRAFVADTLPPIRRAATREQDRGGPSNIRQVVCSLGGCPRGKGGWSATGFPLRDAEHQQRARRRVVPRPTIGHRSSDAKAIVGPNRGW